MKYTQMFLKILKEKDGNESNGWKGRGKKNNGKDEEKHKDVEAGETLNSKKKIEKRVVFLKKGKENKVTGEKLKRRKINQKKEEKLLVYI